MSSCAGCQAILAEVREVKALLSTLVGERLPISVPPRRDSERRAATLADRARKDQKLGR